MAEAKSHVPSYLGTHTCDVQTLVSMFISKSSGKESCLEMEGQVSPGLATARKAGDN